jgi:hypothetical protein
MSTSLYWLPNESKEPNYLGKGLKYHLSPKVFGHDGSLYGEKLITKDYIPFLEGKIYDYFMCSLR